MASAVATTPVVAQPVALPAQSQAPTQEKKYLDYCVEQIKEDTIKEFESNSSYYSNMAWASIIAYSVLAISAFVVTGVFAPVYVPIAGICAYLGANHVFKFYKSRQQYSESTGAQAGHLKTISNNHQNLAAVTPDQLQWVLLRMGISWLNIPGMVQQPQDLNTLKPLIARHQFWEGHVQGLEQKKQADLQEALRLATENYPENRAKIYDLRTDALEIDRQILEAKVKDAFVLAAIQRPTMTGTIDSIGDFSNLSNQERVIGNAVGDITINKFFNFKNTSFAALTIDEVANANAVVLSQRLLTASA
jgi:hypothetical protein